MAFVSSYIFMAVSFLCCLMYCCIFYRTKRYCQLFTGIMFFFMGTWGMTAGQENVEWIKILNTIITPIAAAFFGFFGSIIKLVDAINNKHI